MNQVYFRGGRLAPYGKLEIAINTCTKNTYDKVKISVSGNDNNGHSVSASVDCSIEYIPNIDGIYMGPATGTQGKYSFSVTLTFNVKQNGKDASGTWLTDGGTAGIFEGKIDGTTFSADVTMVDPCYGLYKATGEIKNWGSRITGSYSGSSTCLGNVNATFTVYRQ